MLHFEKHRKKELPAINKYQGCPVCHHAIYEHLSYRGIPIPCFAGKSVGQCQCRFYEDYEHDEEYAAFAYFDVEKHDSWEKYRVK